MEYFAMDRAIHHHVKVVFLGAPGAGKAELVQSGVFAGSSHYTYRTACVQVIVSNYTFMERQYLLEVCNVEGDTDEPEVDRILGDAHAVVLVYDHHRHQPTLDLLSQVWVPRVAKCTKRSATCFMTSTRNIGMKTRVVAFPLCTDEELVFRSLPTSREYVRIYEGEDCDDDFARRVVETAIRNHDAERRCRTCVLM